MTTANTVDALTLRHFTLSLDKQRLAWLRIDMADSTVNRLSSEVMQELGQVLDHLVGHAQLRLGHASPRQCPDEHTGRPL